MNFWTKQGLSMALYRVAIENVNSRTDAFANTYALEQQEWNKTKKLKKSKIEYGNKQSGNKIKISNDRSKL